MPGLRTASGKFSINGARRWISLAGVTLQPSEVLKIAYILYLAAWFLGVKNKIGEIRFGFIPFCVITGLVGAALVIQPDNDTFLVIAASGLAMFVAAGARWRDLALLAAIGLIGAIIDRLVPPVCRRTGHDIPSS